MHKVFLSILITSAVGTVLALVLSFLRPITRKLFSAHWHYYMWLTVSAIMILPIKISLSNSPVAVPNGVLTYVHEISTVVENTGTKVVPSALETNAVSLSAVCFCISFVLLVLKFINYFSFLIRIRQQSLPVCCPEISSFTDAKIRVRKSNALCSPLITGIFFHTLLLPDTEMTPTQLRNILFHETTHLKRGDIVFKWFVSIVKCIHWFNPAVYFINRQIDVYCEISCDIKVTENMNKEEKLSYDNTILYLLSTEKVKRSPLSTGMTANKKVLKRRFEMIKQHKKSTKFQIIISVVSAAIIIITSIFASGVFADNVDSITEVSDSFKWPCRDTYVLSRGFDQEDHPAIDIPAKGGSDVTAVYGGDVISVGFDSERGNYILTDNGTSSVLYAHLSSVDVQNGDTVSSGDVIGKVGKTGRATGDHLHLEITEHGKAINPLDFIEINITEPPKKPF